jgi:peptide subunit release factor 1 (eRF1)
MISRRRLRQLVGFRRDEGIVSVYLPLEEAHRSRRPDYLPTAYKSVLKDYLRQNAETAWRFALDREETRIVSALQGDTLRGRGLALFTCEPAALFDVMRVPVPLGPEIAVSETPNLRPLTAVADQALGLVVVAVAKDRARILVTEGEEVRASRELYGDYPGHHKQGGEAQMRLQRHTEEHAHVHLKNVVAELTAMTKARPIERLVAGGPEEPLARFLELLPEPLIKSVIGTIPTDLKGDSDEQILERARTIRDDHERRREAALVEAVIDAARSGGRGALGLDPTLLAIVEGRVHQLVVTAEASGTGIACRKCEYLEARDLPQCPACGGSVEPVADIVERAIEHALLAGGMVDVVAGVAAERLAREGGVGAMLRY